MAGLRVAKQAFGVQSSAMATNQEYTMDDFDELAGRIDGIAQALLRLTSELEAQGVMDGSRVSAAWVQVADLRPETTAVHRSAHRMLRQLAQLLDGARQARTRHP